MNEENVVKIFLISNGFRYGGKVLSENESLITILDERSNQQITFPKVAVIIQRSA